MARPSRAVSADAAVSQTIRALLGLRNMILQGELSAGARIVEVNLVERLGVSRTPVRSALTRLQDEGLIEALVGGGYVVKSFTQEEILDAIEVRGTLEGLAARLAAERGPTPSDLAAIDDTLSEIDTALAPREITPEGFAAYVTLNDRFHRELTALPRSEILASQIVRASNVPFASPNAFVMAQATLPSARDVLLLAQGHHRGAVEAVRSREGTRAEALMREHARIAHRFLQSAGRNQNIIRLIPGGGLLRARTSK